MHRESLIRYLNALIDEMDPEEGRARLDRLKENLTIEAFVSLSEASISSKWQIHRPALKAYFDALEQADKQPMLDWLDGKRLALDQIIDRNTLDPTYVLHDGMPERDAASHYYELSREQAFALEARVIQRLAPLLTVRDHASAEDVGAYFSSLLEFSYLLADIGLGNEPIERAKLRGKEFYDKLNKAELFDGENSRAAKAITFVADALGQLQLIDVSFQSGLAREHRANPDVAFLIGYGAAVLPKIGMRKDAFRRPAAVDCDFIFKSSNLRRSLVDPQFFSRSLWANVELPLALRTIYVKRWESSLGALGLTGIASSFANCLDGMHLAARFDIDGGMGPMTVNNVTISLDNNSSFTGPLAVGENIKSSYSAAVGTERDELRKNLEQVVELVGKLVERLEDQNEKVEVSTQLKAFVEQARSEKPTKWLLSASAEGILKAAGNVASMVAPVAAAIAAVLKLVGP